MRGLVGFLAVPVSVTVVFPHLLRLAEASAPPQQWPHNLPPHVKYWPEDRPNQIRDLEGIYRQQFMPLAPKAVKKMSTDEGEKFYLHYWEYDSVDTVMSMSAPEESCDSEQRDVESGQKIRPRVAEHDREYNASMPMPFSLPLRRHTQDTSPNPHFKKDLSYYSSLFLRPPRAGLAELVKRGFQCPTGSSDCGSIGRPNTCCNQGETCSIIPDTGLGDVGCCPPLQACSGSLNNCDLGFTKCSDNLGGGCCIPMYVCIDVGCECLLMSILLITLTFVQVVPVPLWPRCFILHSQRRRQSYRTHQALLLPPAQSRRVLPRLPRPRIPRTRPPYHALLATSRVLPPSAGVAVLQTESAGQVPACHPQPRPQPQPPSRQMLRCVRPAYKAAQLRLAL